MKGPIDCAAAFVAGSSALVFFGDRSFGLRRPVMRAVARPDLSAVMPTANRPDLARRAVLYFERRAPHVAAELIIVDASRDPGPLRELALDRGHVWTSAPPGTLCGEMRNMGCEAARAAVVANQDDDDLYLPGWYGAAIRAARAAPAGVAYAPDFYAYEIETGRAFKWLWWGRDPSLGGWSGATSVYLREAWAACRYGPARIDSDGEFIRAQARRTGAAIGRVDRGGRLFVHIRHGANHTGAFTMPAPLAGGERRRALGIIGPDLGFYRSLANGGAAAAPA